jgi:hypothetical protein
VKTANPASAFRRRLTSEALKTMTTHPLTRAILDIVVDSDELDLHLRGTYVDVYFAGFNVFQIKPAARSIRLGSENENEPRPHPWTQTWMPLDSIDPSDIPPSIEWVKQQRAVKLVGRESEFESKVVLDNRSADAPVLVLDRQVVQPGWRMRLDLLLYDTEVERLVLAELKLLTNKEVAGDVFEQLLGYQGLMANNPLIPAAYPHVFEQKSTLGLVKHDLSGLRVDRPPLLLYLLAGYEGSKTSSGKVERLRNAVDHKRKNFSTLRVHTHAFGDFRNESCRLPSIVSLPLFEEWAARELPGA